HPDVVIVLGGGVGQLRRRAHGVVEPRGARDVGGHQPAGVDDEEHLLPPLGLVLPGDHLAAPGGGLPVDVPDVVAGHPLAQRLEQPAFAQPAYGGRSLLASPHGLRHRRPQPHRDDRRVDRDLPRQRHGLAPQPQPERPLAVHDEPSLPAPPAPPAPVAPPPPAPPPGHAGPGLAPPPPGPPPEPPRQRHGLAPHPQPERPLAVHDDPSLPAPPAPPAPVAAARAAAPHGHDGQGFAPLAAGRHRERAGRLDAAQQLRPHLPHAQPGPPPGAVRPEVHHFAPAAAREGRRGVPHDLEPRRT